MKRAVASGAVALMMSWAAAAQNLDLPDAARADAGSSTAAAAKSDAKKTKDATKSTDLGLPDLELDGGKAAAATAKKDRKVKTKTTTTTTTTTPAVLPDNDLSLTIPAAPPAAATTTTTAISTTTPAATDASKSATATPPAVAGAASTTTTTVSSTTTATAPATAAPAAGAAPAATPAPFVSGSIAPPPRSGAAGPTQPKPATTTTTTTTVTLGAKGPAPVLTDRAPGSAPSGQRGYPSAMPVAPPEKTLWNAELVVGAERSTEQYMDNSTSILRVGLSGSRTFAENWRALASFDLRSYKQGYAINATTSSGSPNQPVMLDEQRYDLAGGIGYDFGSRITDRLTLMPAIQVRFMRLQNEVFPSSLFGIELGGRFAYELSSAVSVHAGFGYTFNFTQSDTQSGVGAPKGLSIWNAGLDLPLSGGYALSLNYEGNIIAMSNVYRLAQGASLGFGYSF